MTQTGPPHAQAIARFATVTTDQLAVSFPTGTPLNTFDPYTRSQAPLGVGVTELTVPGIEPLLPDAGVEVPCGQGPVVEIDGRTHDTRLPASIADLRALRPVTVDPCAAGPSTRRLSV